MHEAARLLRTVRHLRCSQWVWRGRYLIERRWPPRAAREAPTPASASPAAARWIAGVPLGHRPSPAPSALLDQLSQGRIELLHQSRPLDPARPDWYLGPCREGRLWVVTWHYHGWAHALAEAAAAGEARAARWLSQLLTNWLDHCDLDQPGPLPLAGNSYAMATRLSWWARTWALLHRAGRQLPVELSVRWLRSAARQAQHLQAHLEWDLRANHLLRDAVGLAWAGRWLDVPAAGTWLDTAAALAASQLEEQVLGDGGHFERSPMYHLQAMEDFLALACLLADRPLAGRIRHRWSQMAHWLAWVQHPDGQIPLVNDAALNGAQSPQEMLDHGRAAGWTVDVVPPRGGRHLADTGLAVWHGDPWSVFWDLGPLGPDYQPGHGHADTLSLEASFQGARLLVDPGTFDYDDHPHRAALRGTARHNTVGIDEQDSSEVWSIFRVGRRARPRQVAVQADASGLAGTAAHDGYDHLPGGPRHTRSVAVRDGAALEVVDQVRSGQAHQVAGGWLLHPRWQVRPASDGWLLGDGSRQVLLAVASDRPLERHAECAEYCPEFGLVLPTVRLAWSYRGQLPLEVRSTFTPQ
jgi:uncharacterized heparinase superfamily protein